MSRVRALVKSALPERAQTYLRDLRARRARTHVESLPELSESDLRGILVERLGLRQGDIAFVHSSMDRLNLSFPFFRILTILRECVGDTGTLLFPTYPRESSAQFLASGQVFDVRKSPSYTGLLTEFARRQRSALRSLHPVKSACACGPAAEELTRGHETSPYPYDECSPYGKTIAMGGKIIGVGVGTYNLSAVHCVEDALGERFPVAPYHPEPFDAACRNARGENVIVRTYAHDPTQIVTDIPKFMRAHVPASICEGFVQHGMPFFRADAQPLFEHMLGLAREGKTIYARRVYRREFR